MEELSFRRANERHLAHSLGCPRLVLRASLIFAVGLLAFATSNVHAQSTGKPFSTSSSGWEGYSEFVRLAQRQLGSRRVQLTARLDYRTLHPSDALIIVRPVQRLDETSLSAFLADGGRVALLDDYGRGEGLLRKFKIQRGSAPADPQERLRNNPALPIAVPSQRAIAGTERGRHPITANVERVATNHPVTLSHPDLTTVLEIRDKTGRASPLAVTGVIAKRGRLFALGDPSVFINMMMRYPGNRALAEGLIRYMGMSDAEGQQSEGRRPTGKAGEGRVLIVANDFAEEGRYGQEESLLNSVSEKLKALRESLVRVSEEGLPNELALALSALLGIWIFTSQLRNHLRVPALIGHGFAQAPILTAQTGLGARASILNSPKSHPILALTELDAALRETVSRRLGLNPSGTRKELESSFRRFGLSASLSEELALVLTELRGYGQSLAEGKPKKTTGHAMKRLHTQTMRLLDQIELGGHQS